MNAQRLRAAVERRRDVDVPLVKLELQPGRAARSARRAAAARRRRPPPPWPRCRRRPRRRSPAPGKKRAKRRASSGTTSSAVSVGSSAGLGIAAAPATPSTTSREVLRQIEVRRLAVGGQARRPPVELDRVVVEVLACRRRASMRAAVENDVAGLAQEASRWRRRPRAPP